MNATLQQCCASLPPGSHQRLDLNCMALPAGKDALSALLALVQGPGASSAGQPGLSCSRLTSVCWESSCRVLCSQLAVAAGASSAGGPALCACISANILRITPELRRQQQAKYITGPPKVTAGSSVLEQLRSALQQAAPTPSKQKRTRTGQQGGMVLLVLDELDALLASDSSVLVELFRLAHVRCFLSVTQRLDVKRASKPAPSHASFSCLLYWALSSSKFGVVGEAFWSFITKMAWCC